MSTLEIGRSIPDITLEDSKGTRRRLKDLIRSWLVVYFYPKDMTPGCTTEACDFTDLSSRFEALDVAVVGVSPDGVKSHAAFIAKEKLGIELLSDPPAEGGTPRAATAFGVWGAKSMYGRTYMGVLRSTFLVSRDGRVARSWENVKVPGHAAEVLATVEAMAGGSSRAATPAARKPVAKKPVAKKAPGKKAPVNKASVKKSAARKAPAKKAPSKKAPSKKPVATKASPKKRAGARA